MKVKISEASGSVLDWMVAKCEGRHELAPFWVDDDKYGNHIERPFSPSTDWAQGGPIIEREIVERGLLMSSRLKRCEAVYPGKPEWAMCYGPTPLIAAMRCLVVSKLGEEVEVPDELA